MKNAFNNEITRSPRPLLPQKRARIGGLDVLRGLCVLLMVLDHLAFDIMYLPGFCDNFYLVPENALSRLSDWVTYSYWYADWRIAIRLPVIATFFIISGICSSFSKSNRLRGIKLLLASLVLSFATFAADDFFDAGLSILFGVLHCFTVAVFIYVLLDLLLKDKSKYACLGLGFLLMIWGMLIHFYEIPETPLAEHELNFANILRVIGGFAYFGGDCFGIIPYAGFFLVGVYGGKALYEQHKRAYLPLFNTKPFAPVRFIGKNALWAYLLHQPLVLGIVALIAMRFGYSFGF